MRPKYSFLLIAVLVLGVFYPSIFAESLSTDDREMIQGFINMNGMDWQGLFWPSSSVYYYRPLLMLSFYADHLLFGSHASFTHLVNVLLHLGNTWLLFALLRTVVAARESEWPLLAAVFFGIHPLVTEPVNWISGRTDLLAGFFVLLSFLLFLRNSEKTPRHDLMAALFYLFGLWSKEVAIGLLPMIVFVCLQDYHFALRRKWCLIVRRVAPFLAVTLVYGIMRTGGQLSHDVGLGAVLHGAHGAEHFALFDKFLSMVKAIGFYSQKSLWPFPLNFAIVEINGPVALAMGIITLAGLVAAWLFFRRRPVMLGLVWIPCFLAPALPVAVNRVAWTPLAERYIYLPLMGLCLILVILLVDYSRGKKLAFAMSLLILVFGTATAQRNMVWQRNITLWQDVVEKSPNFAGGHNDYALALLREGRKEEAQQHFALAGTLAEGVGKSRAQSNLAMHGEGVEQQLLTLEAILQHEQNSKMRLEVLNKMIFLINNELIHKEVGLGKQRILKKKLLACQKQLAELDTNPYHLYRIGQLHLALGEKTEAQAAFETTCQASNDYFTQPACTLAKRLAQEIIRE